ncbi:unnamed protein product [Lampetra planeri]
MISRRILRKRWLLSVVLGASLIYFLKNTIRQADELTGKERSLLQAQDPQRRLDWRVRFTPHNGSGAGPPGGPPGRCRNSVQGRMLLTDERGFVCERRAVLPSGCCNDSAPGSAQYSCQGCQPNGCCSIYEHCVSCCLQPEQQAVLERFLGHAAAAFQNLFLAVRDHFELCLAKCRTSSQSVQHENTYRDPRAKYCYGEDPPELLPV